MELHKLNTGRTPRVGTACRQLSQHLFNYQVNFILKCFSAIKNANFEKCRETGIRNGSELTLDIRVTSLLVLSWVVSIQLAPTLFKSILMVPPLIYLIPPWALAVLPPCQYSKTPGSQIWVRKKRKSVLEMPSPLVSSLMVILVLRHVFYKKNSGPFSSDFRIPNFEPIEFDRKPQ